MEFGKVGQHCTVQMCNQQDFLPFECEFCKKITCTKHARPDDHNCEVGGDRDSLQVILCPICDSRIRITIANLKNTDKVWQHHVDSGECKKEQDDKRKRDFEEAQKVKKCQHPKCSKQLTDTNRIQCSSCLMTLCLTHRFPEAHDCRKLVTKDPRLAKSKLLQRRGPTQVQQEQQPVNSQADVNLLNSQINQFSSQSNTFQFGGQLPQATAPVGREKCPVCGQGFPDIMALISHSEAAHQPKNQDQEWEQIPAALLNPPKKVETEKCTMCSKRFSLAELPTHMQQDHFIF